VQVLIASFSGLLGGAERLLLDFGEGLEGEVVVACPPGPLLDAARDAGFPTRELRGHAREVRASRRDRVRAVAGLAGHGREVRALARATDPDVLIAWGMRTALAAAPLLARRRGSRPAFLFQHNDVLPGPLIGALIRAAARRADAVSALSETIARDLDPRHRLGRKLRVIRPGVDLARFSPEGPPAPEPCAALVGAISDWKRPDLALEIVAGAAQRLPGLRLLVAGGPIDDDGRRLLGELERRAGAPDLAGRVEFLGWTPDATDALAGATCLLHCADREPLGMVLIEALACGRPVVAPDGGGPRELIDPEVGRLYPPGDAQAGADALTAVAGDAATAARMGAAARRRAEAAHDRAGARAEYAALVAGMADLP
jgi:glycosyltransferase involved in cell wall biosynthesis